jgi:hypothetical protein
VELLEIVPSLRAMAAAESKPMVKEAMIRLADRYAAMISRSPPYYRSDLNRLVNGTNA